MQFKARRGHKIHTSWNPIEEQITIEIYGPNSMPTHSARLHFITAEAIAHQMLADAAAIRLYDETHAHKPHNDPGELCERCGWAPESNTHPTHTPTANKEGSES